MDDITMTKDMKIQAFSMLLEGYSYQETANHFGVSRQRIHQIFHTRPKVSKYDRTDNLLKGCIYPNLQKAIESMDWTTADLFRQMYNCEPFEIYKSTRDHYYATVLKNKFQGKRLFFAWEWLKLSEILNLPLEILLVDNLKSHSPNRQKTSAQKGMNADGESE